jgi:hypothetical protein
VHTESNSEKRTPEIIRHLENVEVTRGDGATFRCKVAAYPQPLVRWYIDGKPLQPCDRLTMSMLLALL